MPQPCIRRQFPTPDLMDPLAPELFFPASLTTESVTQSCNRASAKFQEGIPVPLRCRNLSLTRAWTGAYYLAGEPQHPR